MITFIFLLLYTGCNTDATRSLSLLVVVVLIVSVAPLPLLYLRYESFAKLVLATVMSRALWLPIDPERYYPLPVWC